MCGRQRIKQQHPLQARIDSYEVRQRKRMAKKKKGKKPPFQKYVRLALQYFSLPTTKALTTVVSLSFFLFIAGPRQRLEGMENVAALLPSLAEV